MTLAYTAWGDAPPSVLLLHGMLGSADSWWRVAPVLAERGHGVIALDLPGHGRSAPDRAATVARVVDAVVTTWRSLSDGAPRLAIGHSYGGTVLGAALPSLRPERAVFVDSPFITQGAHDVDEARAYYSESVAARTAEGLRARRPFYSERDIDVEALAATRFDVETAVALSASPGDDWTPDGSTPALMVRPAPSSYITDEVAAELRARGLAVTDVPGAEHSLWYSHFDEFIAAIDGWY